MHHEAYSLYFAFTFLRLLMRPGATLGYVQALNC